MINLPLNDPHILVSYLNTLLRDNEGYDFEDICDIAAMTRSELEEYLATAGYHYVENLRRFK